MSRWDLSTLTTHYFGWAHLPPKLLSGNDVGETRHRGCAILSHVILGNKPPGTSVGYSIKIESILLAKMCPPPPPEEEILREIKNSYVPLHNAK